VEEEGRNLTAAQVQLIALARAWLTAPDLLVLDEATSSLDPATERHVLAATKAMDCTTIMVTHRLPVAQSADLVVVVADGAIVESGKPSALKRRANSAYAQLWAAGPEVEARVAAGFIPAEDDTDLEAHEVALAASAVDDEPLVRALLEDLRTGALGASNHTLDADEQGTGPSAATAALAGKVIGETDEELEAFLVGAGGAGELTRAVLDTLRSGIDPAVVGDLAVAFEVVDGDEVHRFVLVSEESAAGAVVHEGGHDANLTLRIGGPDLLRLAVGKLDPIEGVMAGRIQLTGDLEQVARLGEVFAAGAAIPVG
jgi:putative sterol carrier protein